MDENEDPFLMAKVWAVVGSLMLIIVFTLLIIAGKQAHQRISECEQRGGVQIDQYHCIDKRAIR